ncbi:MAG: hypothetical protein H6812_03595 [Phycisphaeraceae bacterium]|nr:hypothetical protein [Phycisphaerales bacterium]MCB9842321.1 hypothetical protein [Phycisphaeraceae bacterium]
MAENGNAVLTNIFDEVFPDESAQLKELGASEADLHALVHEGHSDEELGRPFELDYAVVAGFYLACLELARRTLPKLRAAAGEVKSIVSELNMKAEFRVALDEVSRSIQIEASLRSEILALGFKRMNGVSEFVAKCGKQSPTS